MNDHPIGLVVDDDLRRNRLTVFFRLLLAIPQSIWIWLWSIAVAFTVLFRIVLAIPALLLCYVFRIVNQIVAFLGWFYALFTGRMHEGMRDVSAWMLRYELQSYGYLMLLTGTYPSLSGGPTA